MTRTGEEAFREIQALAKRDARGNTQAVLEQFVHERFLARLSASRFVDRFVLKGGMLLAVMDLRRATRDADVMVTGIAMESDELIDAIQEILAIELADGVTFDGDEISAHEIRETAEYAGLRFGLDARVGGAKVKLKLDMSTGDPVAPVKVQLPTLLDDLQIELCGYPLENVIAEKAETMISWGDANTRMRDFADVHAISQRHSLELGTLRLALFEIAAHRETELITISSALVDFVELRQIDWARFVDQMQMDGRVPAQLSEVVEAVCRFIDPVVAGGAAASVWDPQIHSWATRTA